MVATRVRTSGASSSGHEDRSPGETSTAASSNSTLTDRVGNWSMDDLHLTWDNSECVRSRMREVDQLLQHLDPKSHEATNRYVEKCVTNPRLNHAILSPVFKLMALHDRTLPSLDKLMEQVTLLFKRSKVVFNNHGDRVYQDSWAIRRLCSLGKAQLHRNQWPKDCLFRKQICFIYVVAYN